MKSSADRRREESGAKRRRQGSWRHHLTPIRIGVGIGVVVLGLALLLGPTLRGREETTLSGIQGGREVTPGLLAAAEVPINDVDPVTGKPIEPSSPTLTYKGHTIAFCCASSSGYKGGWAQMTEAAKDAFVSRYLQ